MRQRARHIRRSCALSRYACVCACCARTAPDDIALPGHSAVHGPEAALVRPHPALWRLWHGVSVAYMLFLAFLLFQTPAGARSFLKVWPKLLHHAMRASVCGGSRLAQNLSPSLGVELVERAYGEDCRPLYRNVRCSHAAGGASPERAHATPRACRAMIMDEFVIAHTLGWWAKALMLRHSGMCVRDNLERHDAS